MSKIWNVTNKEYHEDRSAISSSGIKVILKSAKKFYRFFLDKSFVRKPSTPDQEFGTYVHSLCLESEKIVDEYYVMPQGIDRRTTEGKKLFAEFGKTHKTVKYEDNEQALEMVKSIFDHEYGKLILGELGFPEHTIVWEEKIETEDGVFITVVCKVRLDYFIYPCELFPNGLIIDLKTTTDADDGFEKQAYNLQYHISAALYCRGVKIHLGLDQVPPFVFLAVEKDDPYEVKSHVASDDMLQKGWTECLRGLKKYAIGISTGIWDGLSKESSEINLPRYAKENYV